jgi:hypothetical protein
MGLDQGGKHPDEITAEIYNNSQKGPQVQCNIEGQPAPFNAKKELNKGKMA